MATKGAPNSSVNNFRDVSAATSQLKINGHRLMETLHEGCEFGADHRYGEYVHPSGTIREGCKYCSL